jgi:acetyl-CoA carboxylase alpha subunit
MNAREQLRAEMESELKRIDETISELKQKADKQKVSLDEALGMPYDEFLALKEKIAAHLKDLSRAEDVSVEKIRDTLEKYIGDVDESFRRAITYYK